MGESVGFLLHNPRVGLMCRHSHSRYNCRHHRYSLSCGYGMSHLVRGFCLLAIVALFMLFSSCASVPYLRTTPGIERQHFATLESLTPVWSPYAKSIQILFGSVASPALEFTAIRADLNDPTIEICVSAPGERVGVIPSNKVTTFAAQSGSVVTINANPFSPVSTAEGEPRTISGIAVSAGRVVAHPDPRYAAALISPENAISIVEQRDIRDLSAVYNAVGGFFVVLKSGRAVGIHPQRHPRTALGADASGKVLYMLVVDGRRAASVGTTEYETGLLLNLLGAENGLILDGGGSTAMALRSDGRVVLGNVPIHDGIPGNQRAVGTCLGLRIKP